MHNFKFPIAAFVFILPIGSNEDRDSLSSNRNGDQVFGQNVINIASSKEVYYHPPYHIITCKGNPPLIANGKILASLDFTYTITCDEDHTIPLGSLDKWKCISNTILETPQLNNQQNNYSKYGAYECVEKLWPETIYIEQQVTVFYSSDYRHDKNDLNKRMTKSVSETEKSVIFTLEFTMKFIAIKTNCYPSFNSSNHHFMKWACNLTFRLVHKPIYQKISPTLLTLANRELRSNITKILSRTIVNEPKLVYNIEKDDDKFHPGNCLHEGSMIEQEFRAGFQQNIPFCRKCQRGYYLNVNKGICLPCKMYHYSDTQGAIKCKYCHNVHTKVIDENWDSVLDCYQWSKDRVFTAVNRGSIFIITFHVIYIGLVTWNIRSTMQLMLNKRHSTGEKETSV